jgi:hypothetical protein
LLGHVDHHVTVFSSVVTEAAAFDVRSSLIGDVGANAFARYVERDICRYTPTAESLVAHITTDLAAPRRSFSDDFIDSSSDTARRALAQLLS